MPDGSGSIRFNIDLWSSVRVYMVAVMPDGRGSIRFNIVLSFWEAQNRLFGRNVVFLEKNSRFWDPKEPRGFIEGILAL